MTPIPAGWKLVPIEPTDAMLDAGCGKHVCTQGDPWYSSPDLSEGDCKAIYAAMLDSALSPASVAPGDAQDERPPLFWYRPRSDDGYEGPIHNDRIEDVRKRSGAWVPLYPGFATLPKPLSDLRYHGEFIRGWNQCLREVSASVAAPAAGDAQELLGALIEARRELHACQAVIHLAGGFDPAYVRDAQAALKRADAAIAAQQGKGGEA